MVLALLPLPSKGLLYPYLPIKCHDTYHNHTQYDPVVFNIFDLLLDFREKFPHSYIQINTSVY